MHHSLLTTKEHLDGFQFLVIMDKAAINIHIRVFFFFFFFLGQKCLFPGYQARRLLHHMVTLAETIKLFVKMAISFCIPTTMTESSYCSTLFPAFSIVSFGILDVIIDV